MKKRILVLLTTVIFAVILATTVYILCVLEQYVIVAQDGSGDYTTISDAIESSELGGKVKIIVKEGCYNEVLNIGSKYDISIIGVNKNRCVVYSTSGKYKDAPIFLSGNFTLKNLTIMAIDDGKNEWSPTYEQNVGETFPSYALHIDGESRNKDMSTYGLVSNCVLYSDFFPAIGIGINNNQSVEIKNCEVTRNISREEFCWDNCQGAMICHSSAYEEDVNQRLILRNNEFNCNRGYAAHIDCHYGNPSEFEMLAINNRFNSAEMGEDSLLYIRDESALDVKSKGNTASAINYHVNTNTIGFFCK